VAERYVQLIRAGQQFAQHAGSGSGLQLRQLSLGDLVLAGTEEKLDLCGPLSAVYLQHRVERLVKVAGPAGLLATLRKVRSMLTVEPLAHFNKLQRKRRAAAGSSSSPAAAFAAFLAGRVVAVQEQLQAHMKVVAQDMPCGSAPKPQECMQQVLSYMQNLLDCAREDEASSSRSSGSSSDSDSLKGSLWLEFTKLEARKRSPASFDNPADDLKPPAAPSLRARWAADAAELQIFIPRAEGLVPAVLRGPPTYKALEEFCLSSCTHLFCTVATAGAGYMAAMGSFSLVVLDEAAQVRQRVWAPAFVLL
jgi:hypothetical protein